MMPNTASGKSTLSGGKPLTLDSKSARRLQRRRRVSGENGADVGVQEATDLLQRGSQAFGIAIAEILDED
jgi:hypothetical protein